MGGKGSGRATKLNILVTQRVIKNMVGAGHTMEQVAKIMGVCTKTLYNWINGDKDLLQSIQESRSIANDNVEDAVMKSALGYDYEETKTTTESGQVTKVETTKKQVAPSIAAQKFWLTNRANKEWADKKEIEGDIRIHTITDLIASHSRDVTPEAKQLEGNNDEDDQS